MSEIQTPASVVEQPHIMPCPPTMPWNSQEMPWAVTGYNGLMEFTAAQTPGLESLKSLCTKKRKFELENCIPEKQFITEEKMAAHLDGLHISSEYIAHKLNSPNNTSTTVTVPTDFAINHVTRSTRDCTITMSSKDHLELEEKLKNANRISICDEIRRLHTEDSIIPKALLAHFEKPCKALVLWQPPQTLVDMIVPSAKKDEEIIEDGQNDNNNSNVNVDLNYSMDVEM